MLAVQLARSALLVLVLLAAGSAVAEEMKTWTNKTIGFSIQYPSWVTPQFDAAAVAKAVTDGQEMLDGDFEGVEAGQQFLFLMDPPGSKPVVSNLGLNTASGIKKPRGMSSEELCRAALEGFPSVMPGALLRAPIDAIEMGGKTWYRADFEFVTSGLQLTARSMVHHSRQSMYTLTFVDESATFDDNVARARVLLASVKLTR